jgi:hypothetical protein
MTKFILEIGARVRVENDKDYNHGNEGSITEIRVYNDVPMYTVDFGNTTDPYYSSELKRVG